MWTSDADDASIVCRVSPDSPIRCYLAHVPTDLPHVTSPDCPYSLAWGGEEYSKSGDTVTVTCGGDISVSSGRKEGPVEYLWLRMEYRRL